MVVTTNLPFGDWVQVFGDERLTTGLLDRITYRAHIVEFVGESYRFRQRLDQHTPLANDDNTNRTPSPVALGNASPDAPA